MTAALLSLVLVVGSRDPREVVSGYLDALRALDQARMDSHCAPDVVSIAADGSQRRRDAAAARDMRDFERGMNTVWTYRIVCVDGERVTVDLSEQNDFYDRLGVGRRTQREVYVVRDGLVRRIETSDVRHERGDYRAEYARFKAWLLSTPATADARLVHEGGLRFDAESAKAMSPWLEKWSRKEKKWEGVSP